MPPFSPPISRSEMGGRGGASAPRLVPPPRPGFGQGKGGRPYGMLRDAGWRTSSEYSMLRSERKSGKDSQRTPLPRNYYKTNVLFCQAGGLTPQDTPFLKSR